MNFPSLIFSGDINHGYRAAILKKNYLWLLSYEKVRRAMRTAIVSYLLNEIPLKVIKNAFNFILKSIFVLKIFKFLSSRFGHVEKPA